MAGISNTEADAILNHLFRTATYTKPTNRWLALFVGDPNGAGAEVTGTDYARVAISVADASWDAPADDAGNRKIQNASAITFNGGSPVGGTWSSGSTINFWALMDASTAGNVRWHGAIASPFVILNGNEPPTLPIGDLDLSIDPSA